MKTAKADAVIAELHAVRDAYAARFGYDVRAIFADLRAAQEASGREYVSLPPRRPANPDGGPPQRRPRGAAP